MSLRRDGATRGDLAEASALVLAGLMLCTMPVVAALDRLESPWLGLSGAGGLAGLLVAGLGLRWFFKEGPPMVATGVEMEPLIHEQQAPPLPLDVRLVDARLRLVAHGLRFAALSMGLLLLVVPGGEWWTIVVGLFVISVIGDQLLLRPHHYRVVSGGLTPAWRGGGAALPWDDVRKVIWRHYPPGRRPPFPTGERLIIETRSGEDREFVFHEKFGGTDGVVVARAVASVVGDRLHVLRPEARAKAAPARVEPGSSVDEGDG